MDGKFVEGQILAELIDLYAAAAPGLLVAGGDRHHSGKGRRMCAVSWRLTQTSGFLP